MSRSSLLLVFGLLTVIVPYLGLPSSWVRVLLAIFGLTVAGVGFSIRAAQVRNARATAGVSVPSEGSVMSQASHGVSPI